MNEQVNTAYQQTSIASWLSQLDFYGIVLIIIAIVLFTVIVLLNRISKKTKMLESKPGIANAEKLSPAAVSAPPAEVFVAIAMALHLLESELHDAENTILTINRAAKLYSPWSSKIYGLRRCPR
jgi:hypothetical protein